MVNMPKEKKNKTKITGKEVITIVENQREF